VRRAIIQLTLVAGCSFDPTRVGGNDPGTDGNGGDDGSIAPQEPVHLTPEDGTPGTGPLNIDGNATIDTTTPSSSIALPRGVTLDVRPQISGPDVAVLHVGALTIADTATLTITGTRALIIVAGGDVDIAGVIEAGARGQTPGPGGGMPGSGPGMGAVGGHGDNDSDTGGGGGGYGSAGANGGAITGCTVTLGMGGSAFGDATISMLLGGSGGAGSSGNACAQDPGGAGGGAFQITSATRIAIAANGRINAGGGGGRGANDCGQGDVNSGAGGGSGGAIVLQAPVITSLGVVAANGGGGGGSSQTGMGDADPGLDATPSLTPADGGDGPRAKGGSGGIAGVAPTVGGDAPCGGNSAGGGGAVGRIAVSASWDNTGTFSPVPNATLPN
jgi:hypothetical protein